jgi:hypothetical protein
MKMVDLLVKKNACLKPHQASDLKGNNLQQRRVMHGPVIIGLSDHQTLQFNM